MARLKYNLLINCVALLEKKVYNNEKKTTTKNKINTPSVDKGGIKLI